MGSSPFVGITGGTSDKTHGSRWRVHDNGGGHSPTVHYLFVSFLLCSSVGVFYIFYLFNNPNLNYNNSLGCQEDNDGSWAIGAFYGDSPFSLKPIEDVSSQLNRLPSYASSLFRDLHCSQKLMILFIFFGIKLCYGLLSEIITLF